MPCRPRKDNNSLSPSLSPLPPSRELRNWPRMTSRKCSRFTTGQVSTINWFPYLSANHCQRHVQLPISYINHSLIVPTVLLYLLPLQDNNGTIENEELRGFLKDLLELVKKVWWCIRGISSTWIWLGMGFRMANLCQIEDRIVVEDKGWPRVNLKGDRMGFPYYYHHVAKQWTSLPSCTSIGKDREGGSKSRSIIW